MSHLYGIGKMTHEGNRARHSALDRFRKPITSGLIFEVLLIPKEMVFSQFCRLLTIVQRQKL